MPFKYPLFENSPGSANLKFSKELKASIFYENERINESKDLFSEILNSGNVNQRSQERITNILKTFEDY